MRRLIGLASCGAGLLLVGCGFATSSGAKNFGQPHLRPSLCTQALQ